MPDKKEFIQRTKDRSKETTNQVALEILTKMVGQDIKIYDLPYIDARAREILEKKLASIKFVQKELREMRKELLKKYGLKAASKKIKLDKQPDDLTGERNNRCEDIAQFLAYSLLDPENLLSDDAYLDDAIDQDEHLLIFNRARSLADALMDTLLFSTDSSYVRAAEILWGKSKDDITYKELDNILKNAKSSN